jgi:carbonic anhydrase/acetyltransferase-like protein (isoleucine patch superfamily)
MPRKTSSTRKTSARKAAQNPSKARSAKTVTAGKRVPVFVAKIGDEAKLIAAKDAAAVMREARIERDAAIRAAVKGGTSARQVAIAVGLTHAAVLKIVKAA